MKLIKSITKWRYDVALLQLPNGLYAVKTLNFFTNKTKTVKLVDYTLASLVFDNSIANLEGN